MNINGNVAILEPFVKECDGSCAIDGMCTVNPYEGQLALGLKTGKIYPVNPCKNLGKYNPDTDSFDCGYPKLAQPEDGEATAILSKEQLRKMGLEV